MPNRVSNDWNRREILAAGAAALWSLALGRGLRAAEDSGYGPFKMGIQSYSLWAFNTEEALAKTKELGLHYWESFNAHVKSDPTTASESMALAAKSGVKIIGYGVIHFSNDHDANRRLFDFGKAMGLGYFSADPAEDSFDSLDKCVEEYGIAVGIHNHGPGHKYAMIDTIAKAIKDHHKLIGCCVDTGHFLRSKEDPVRAVEVFDKRVYGVHLKDVKDATTFTILGKGDLRTADLLKALADRKYAYCLALEYEENEKQPMDDIRACLDAVRKALPKA